MFPGFWHYTTMSVYFLWLGRLYMNWYSTVYTPPKSGFGVCTGRKRNSLTPRSTLFPCPGCQRDIDLGERGINGLFRNFTLETIVERYRQAARAAIAIMCDFCKPPPQESTKSCMDCSASFCNECFKVHHPWGTVKAQHEYVGPTTNFRPKVSILYVTGICVAAFTYSFRCSCVKVVDF